MGLWLVALALLVVMVLDSPRVIGFDSHAYWLAWHHTSMYGSSPNTDGAFLYSPAFAQLIWPLAQLPWPAFLAFWTVGGLLLYGWLLWPMPIVYRLPLLLICIPQAVIGNIWPLFAVVALVGFRRPSVWAFPLLTSHRRNWLRMVLRASRVAFVRSRGARICRGDGGVSGNLAGSVGELAALARQRRQRWHS